MDTKNTTPLRLMKDRRYEVLPVEKIVVLNSRDRFKARFNENMRSIRDVGLLKPVLVNERFLPTSGQYELVCGEGRLMAYKRLKKSEIPAEVIDCAREDAYLMTLIENMARVRPGTLFFAQEVKRLRDAGMTLLEIGRIVGRSEAHVKGYIRLVEKGEERLLKGVEEEAFPITLAVRIAESDEAKIQNLLMDAFDQGIVTTSNLRQVRKIIEGRKGSTAASPAVNSLSTPESPAAGSSMPDTPHTVGELEREISQSYRQKKSFIREAEAKEGRLVALVEGLRTLRRKEDFVRLLEEEGLAEVPQLEGPYKV